jgi:hypothetical protein
MKIEELFVPYKIAVNLKEKGFDEPCLGYTEREGEFNLFADAMFCNTNSTFQFYPTAPLYQQAIDWIFPKLEFNYPLVSIQIYGDGSGEWYSPEDRDGDDILNEKLSVEFDNLNEAIEEALKLI